MKRIVIDARFWGPSHTGLGRYTESLVSAIYRQKPKFDFTLLVPKSQAVKIQTLLPSFEIIPVKPKHYTFAEQLQLPKIINKLKPDLVHFLHFNVPLFYRQPFIVTIHDLIKHHSVGLSTTTQLPLFYPIKRFGYHLTIAHAINYSQSILCPSAWVKKDILQHYPVSAAKITITPEAAAPIFFQKPNCSQSDFIPAFDYIIYSGNAYPHKNLINLIKAVVIYNQQSGKNLKLIIVTAKDVFYQRLRQEINKINALSVVKIKGFASDEQLHCLYHHSKAFITASRFEGFGLPGLEAMASGTLVLSSNKASLPEVYGKNAYYFNPDNPEEIAKKIDLVINLKNRERQLVQSKLYAQKFSWEKTALATLSAYKKLL